MVSSGQVRSDASDVSSYLSKLNSCIGELHSCWIGNSYDSLSSQVQQFSSEYSSVIISQMSSFASACDLYLDYLNCKSNLDISKGNYQRAVNNGDSTSASNFANQVSSYQSNLTSLKSQIESLLLAVSSKKLEASNVSAMNYVSGKSLGSASANAVVQRAIDWAVAIAADDSHGYSQKTRWGNPNYDCSSLVISAFQAAGVSVKEAGAGYTGNMRSAFTKVGFQWIPGNPDVNSLQPGDVLLSERNHAELYIGEGMNVGAHGDYDGRNGDSSGQEIDICYYRSFPWDGVLRYVGYDSTQGTE